MPGNSRLQTFDDDADPTAVAPRLIALRAEASARQNRRVRPPARGPASERIRAAVGRAPRLADRFHRLGGRRDRAGAPRRAVRRWALYAAGHDQTDPAICSTIENIPEKMPEALDQAKALYRRTASPTSLAAHGRARPKPRAGDCSRRRPARACEENPLDTIWTRAPAGPPRPRDPARPSYCRRRSRTQSSTACSAEIELAKADALVLSPILRASPGLSISAAPTWRTRRWRSRSPSIPAPRVGPSTLTSTAASSAMTCATRSRRWPRCGSRRNSAALAALGSAHKTVRLDQATGAEALRA